ncbi:MAG: translocation/assembly module TamB domain-containing protein [Thiothrix litoralis]|uniref:translocation/assembly module TamB domain-containing protein n=1 Tax=Thiothrix litoralis TaxID=2891210 RepID=UPI003C793618
MKTWLKYLLVHPLAVLLLGVVLALAFGVFLAVSQAGTRLLLGTAQRFVPELALQGVGGALIDGVSLGSLRWEDATTRVEASNVVLKNSLDMGTPPTLHVESLHADKLVVTLQDTPADAGKNEPFELPSILLPLNVDAQQVEIGELEIHTGVEVLRFRDVALTGHTRDGRLQVDSLKTQIYDAQGKADLALDGSMGLDKPHALDTRLNVVSDSKIWGVGKAAIQLGGELQHYDLGLDADWKYDTYPRYQGKLQGKGTFNDLAISQLQLDGEAGGLTAKGSIGWQNGFDWDAALTGKQINPAAFLKEWPAKLDVALTSKGALSGGKTDIALDITQLQGKLRDYPVDAKGQGDWNGKLLALHSLDAKVGDNRLQAKGNAGDKLAVEWQLDAPALTQLYPKIKGNAKGKGVLRGLSDGSQLQLDVADLSGKVEGYDLNAKGKLDWGKQKLAAQDVIIQSGGNRLEVSGQAMEPFDLRWKVDAQNLAKAWKGLEGSLQGEGILKGKLDKPEIQADLKGSKLRYQDYRLGALDLKAQQVNERYDIKGTLRDFKSGDTLIESAKVDGQGSVTNHRVTAQIVHEVGKMDVSASGGWKNEQWTGTIPSLSLRDTPAGDWSMAAPISLQASAKAFSSSRICLTRRDASRACGKPAWTPQAGFSIAGDLQQIPLVMLRPWLPENLSVAGSANADYRFEQRGGKPVAEVALRLPDSSVSMRGSKGKTETLQYTNTRADVSLNDRRMDVTAQLDLVRYGQLRADGRIDLSPADGNHRINARMSANMPDIGWLGRFSPQIDRLQGKVNGDVTITGLLKQPAVTGDMRLTGGQAYLPEADVTLDAIDLSMNATGTERATINGSLRAGAGMMSARGVLSLANLPNWKADVTLQGNNLKLMDTHEVQALVSPDLSIQASPGDVSISGTVLIPEATVSLREIPQTASARSDDVIIVGRSAGTVGQSGQVEVLVKDAPLNIKPNVTIELGDKVKFNGFGLDARLAGKLRVLRTRQDIIAEGVLSVVDGVYKAYGQNLKIERGRLIFNGPLNNPGLDVRAVREVEDGDIKVGISLAGTVQQPESTLFSTPTQTQSDTLSYLLTGRAMSSVSGSQSALLMDAITGLGVAGGESLAQQLGGSLGLDEVGLKAKNGNFDESELALGKRLGARLYVRYIVSLFDSLQRVAITYQINKHLQVEAQAGVQQGVDLIYKIDTDVGPLRGN